MDFDYHYNLDQNISDIDTENSIDVILKLTPIELDDLFTALHNGAFLSSPEEHQRLLWLLWRSILDINESVNTLEFAIAKYVLPANTNPFNPTGSAWNNIPLNTIAVQNTATWASLVGGSTLVSLDVGSYFCYMSSRYFFNASYGLRLYNTSASIELNDAATITSQATVASVDYMVNSAIFTLANVSSIALQLYTTGTNQGSGVSFSSTNFADVVIAKLS